MYRTKFFKFIEGMMVCISAHLAAWLSLAAAGGSATAVLFSAGCSSGVRLRDMLILLVANKS